MKTPNVRLSRRSPMLACLLASGLVLALSSCGNERPQIASPPLADLRGEPEPVLDPAAVDQDSAAALDAYDTAHSAWGRRGWDQVARLRRWFCDTGVKTACE